MEYMCKVCGETQFTSLVGQEVDCSFEDDKDEFLIYAEDLNPSLEEHMEKDHPTLMKKVSTALQKENSAMSVEVVLQHPAMYYKV